MIKLFVRWIVLAIIISSNTSLAFSAEPLQLAYLHPLPDPTHCDKVLIGNIFGDIKQQFDLPSTSGCMPPVWSPDGNYLAVWYPGMMLVDLQNSISKDFSAIDEGWLANSPVWSRNSEYLAWREQKIDGTEDDHWRLLHLADQTVETISDLSKASIGTDEIQVVQIHDQAFYLEQSGQPSEKITLPESVLTCKAYTQFRVDQAQCWTDDEIVLVDAKGSNRIFKFTHRPNIGEGSPQWSPDNKWIVYETLDISTRKTWLEIAVSDGSDLRQITNPDDGTWDVQPQWSPDGEYVAFSRYVGLDNKIYVIKADGTRLQFVGDGMYPAWRPKGQS